MIETAIEMTGGRLEASDVSRIITWGRDMLDSPVELLDGVCEVVEELAATYSLILLTKGDLLHQQTNSHFRPRAPLQGHRDCLRKTRGFTGRS